MPQLKWEPVDVLECFAVAPIVEDYEVAHTYEVHRDGLRLLFKIEQLECLIQASLFRDEGQSPIISFRAYVRGEVRYINDKRGTYLEFQDSILAVDAPLWYLEAGGDVWDPAEFRPFSQNIRVAVDPDIRIEFERNTW